MIPILGVLFKKLGGKALASKVIDKAVSSGATKAVASNVNKVTESAGSNQVSPPIKHNLSLSRLAENEISKFKDGTNGARLKSMINTMADPKNKQPYEPAPIINNLTPNGIPFQNNEYDNQIL